MNPVLHLILLLCLLLPATVSAADDTEKSNSPGDLITIWPLVDYRENKAAGSSKLSLLGPVLSFDRTREDSASAFRPLVHSSGDRKGSMSFNYYLYPLATSETTPDVSRIQFIELFQKSTFRKNEPDETEHDSMIFPFYISGKSDKYGTYTSVFPIYGDIYERFWRDEYHYVLFPLYGRTVNKGTTNYNVLWPFFSVTTGEKEFGWRFWPIYGQAAKEGVYKSSFTLWPIFTSEEKVLENGGKSERFSFFPLYASYDTPSITSRTWIWPFFGYASDREKEEEERNYLWPIWLTVSGKKRNVTKFLPFYSSEVYDDSTKNWYIWPLYKNETLWSKDYRQDIDSILFFLFSKRTESWRLDKKERTRTAFWPLFVYNSGVDGSSSLTMPALIEPILDKDGIEKLWAPLWRIYDQKWSEKGDSSLSLFWNLYWHDKREKSLEWELFPLYRHRSATSYLEMQFLKGLVNFTEDGNKRRLSLFWLPFGFDWTTGAENRK